MRKRSMGLPPATRFATISLASDASTPPEGILLGVGGAAGALFVKAVNIFFGVGRSNASVRDFVGHGDDDGTLFAKVHTLTALHRDSVAATKLRDRRFESGADVIASFLRAFLSLSADVDFDFVRHS